MKELDVIGKELPSEPPSELSSPIIKHTPSSSWRTSKKVYHTAVPCLFAFLITFGTSISGPALPGLMAEFNVDRTVAVLSITFYTEGLAIGPLLLAPIADRYGRRWVYVGAASCLLAFSAGAAVAPHFATHLVCRFFAGCLGSVGIAIGGGSIADLWLDGPGRQGSLLLFVLASFLSPSLAPLAGAYIMRAHQDDWRWSQWLLVMVGLPIWLMILPMQETGQAKERPSRGRAALRSVALPIRMLCTDLIAILLTVHTSFGYGVIFSFFLSFRSILGMSYGFNDREASLSYLSLIIGYGLAIVIYALMDRRRAAAAQRLGSTCAAPEDCLRSSIVGGILVCFGEVWYALAARFGASWPVVVAAGIFIGCGAFLLFLSAIAYISRVYEPEILSCAIAANGVVRYSLGATFPLFTVDMYNKLGAGWASGLFAFLSLLLVPIPLVLVRIGPRLRRSRPLVV